MNSSSSPLLVSILSVFLFVLIVAPQSASAEWIEGVIYCDNYFEFWFNGELIAKDPVFFTPHNAVKVGFEWDEVSDKVYSILCQDFATESGYEYVESNNPGIGDGALMAEFSDGTITSQAWKVYTVTHGPTVASQDAGCGPDNLDACVVENYGIPDDQWFAPDYDDSAWDSATEYDSSETGFGIPPVFRLICGPSRNPFTGLLQRKPWFDFNRLFGRVAYNYDTYVPTLENPWVFESRKKAVSTQITRDECLLARGQFRNSDAIPIWGTDLLRDNLNLFRYTETMR